MKINYQIIYKTEGRLRIRVPQVSGDSEYASKLSWLVKSLDSVTSVRINPAASSLIVCYDISSATVTENIFTCIEKASFIESPPESAALREHELKLEAKTWERLSLPVISLGMALLISPFDLSIPFLLFAGVMAGAAMPIFSKAITGVSKEGKIKVDVLDSLWITLQTLQGQYIAPALMVSLIEIGEVVRDTARANNVENQKLIAQEDYTSTNSTQIGDFIQEVSDKLVIPTLFVSGGIFAVTGNITAALAPLQLDFGTGIGIAVPTTAAAALTHLAHYGVLIRNGRTLEILACVDTIITHTEDFAETKIEVIRRLQSAGKTVAYVKDEQSDTEVLGYVDVSVWFAKGTDVEGDTTDVVIVDNDMRKLTYAIAVAKQAMEIVYQNIAIVAVPNISVVIAGVFFGLHPVAAVVFNNCAAIIAEMNGLLQLQSDAASAPSLAIDQITSQEDGSAILTIYNSSKDK